VREEDAGGREAGAPLDLKMPLENGRADERVSRGQASERAVCVCEAVSVEMVTLMFFCFLRPILGRTPRKCGRGFAVPPARCVS
jgi:hypothetical protein